MKTLFWIALVLLVVGWLNRGLVWIFNFDLVARIFGEMSVVARLVYALVGVSAIYVFLAKVSECNCQK